MSILPDYTLDAKDVARICGVTLDTPRKWRRDGIGPKPIRRSGVKWFYREDEVLEFAAKRMAFEQARAALRPPVKRTTIVRDSPKLRQRLSRGIVKAGVAGCVTLVDAKAITKQLGFASLERLDARGIKLLIAELDKLAAQRPRPVDAMQWEKPSKPKRKARLRSAADAS